MAEQKKKLLNLSKFKLSKIVIPKPTFKDTPINAFLVVTLVIFSFLLGMLTNKVLYLEKALSEGTTITAADAGNQQLPAAPTVTQDQIKALFTGENLIFGDTNSNNLIVEVADPSCPYCHAAAGHNPELNAEIGPQFTLESQGGTYVPPVPEIKKLVDEGKAGFVWIYAVGHGNGEMGTKAMYCARDQGKFWEVHDKLMTSDGYTVLNDQVMNDATKSQQLVDFLSGVADAGTLKSCLDSGKYDAKLQEDAANAASLGISGTPGFFVNTTPFLGAYSWKDMESAIK